MLPSLKTLNQRYIQKQTDFAMRAGQKALLERQHTAGAKTRDENKARYELLGKVQALLLAASTQARNTICGRLENMVSLALSGIIGEPYGFKIELVQSASQWNVNMVVINPDGVELNALDNCGGGIVDIISMALRIALLEMYEPRIQGPLLLDENFKYLSRSYARTATEFIRNVMSKSGRQIILVTHIPELADGADLVLEVEPVGATSHITTRTQNYASLP